MSISVFDLFSIGIGPSSSHTVGPMKAAYAFIEALNQAQPSNIHRLKVELYGSLAFTGKGHGTDKAIQMGFSGHLPHSIDPDQIPGEVQHILDTQQLMLFTGQKISFNPNRDVVFNRKDLLPLHTNGMRFSAYAIDESLIFQQVYYSVGGGFIIEEKAASQDNHLKPAVPYPFQKAGELLALCTDHHLSIDKLMLVNECQFQAEHLVKEKLLEIAQVMRDSIKKGCLSEGVLPGGLHVKKRAALLYQKLIEKGKPSSHQHTNSMEWLNLFAIAVNEENAAGGRVVTAPTNGAAGIIPAVLEYYLTFYSPHREEDAILQFLLTAGAIALLYKKGASISGAEVGCQGEVGVACSMAAAALTAVLGGNLQQIENAAEIGMEHHLGLTCDPIQGLVQIPCIERNAMGAVKAVNAARLALLGDGQHYVSLDKVIATMKQTGHDMLAIYKETSLGGLAANLPEC